MEDSLEQHSGDVHNRVEGFDAKVSGKLGEKQIRRGSNTNSQKHIKYTLNSFRKRSHVESQVPMSHTINSRANV